jgi:hypothetical protein
VAAEFGREDDDDDDDDDDDVGEMDAAGETDRVTRRRGDA